MNLTNYINRYHRAGLMLRRYLSGDYMGAFLDGAKIVLSELHLNDIIDIIVIAYIIYKLFIFIRDSRASLIIKGLLVIVLAYLASVWLDLQMVSTVVETIVRYAGIALVVVFQPEIRSVLERVGRSRLDVRSFFDRSDDDKKRTETLNTISCVVESTRILQKQCMGALIVFEREITLQEIIATGSKMDAAPNVPLIANIFFNKAPLHDGAMIIQNNRIVAASCILPLTQNTDLDPNYGTRHRAAIGMCENSDAVVVVLSEETGRISVAHAGNISSTFDPGELSAKLIELLLPESLSDSDNDHSTIVSKAVAPLRRYFGTKDEHIEPAAQEQKEHSDTKPAPAENKNKNNASGQKKNKGKGGKKR